MKGGFFTTNPAGKGSRRHRTPHCSAPICPPKAHQISRHAAEGVGVRAISRLLSLTKNTVYSAIVKAGEHCQSVYYSLMGNLQMSEAQLGELRTFVKKLATDGIEFEQG